jgi:hypothetical protein
MTPTIAPADVTSDFIFIGLVATFLTVATAWILWYAAEKIFPDDVGQLQFFLTFIVVIIPFVMLIYFGLDTLIDDAVATRAGQPTELPIEQLHEIPIMTAVYVGLTVWFGLRWRKRYPSKRDTAARRGGSR